MSTEADKLAKGVNLLVATPGRLLDHLLVSETRLDIAKNFIERTAPCSTRKVSSFVGELKLLASGTS